MQHASKTAVQAAFAGARMARKDTTAEAVQRQREHVRAVIEAMVQEVRPLFENCPEIRTVEDDEKGRRRTKKRWSPLQARMGLMQHLQPIVMRAAAEIEQGFFGNVRDTRRQAFLRGVNSVAAGLARMGVEPEKAGDMAAVIKSAPTELHLNGEVVEVMDLVAWADRRLREAGSPPSASFSEASVTTVGGDTIEIADESFDVENEPPEFERDNRRAAARALIIEDGEVWLFDPEDEPYVMLPGGGAEEGERLAAAAIRETIEEAGLIVKLVRYLGDFSDEYSQRRYYLAERIGGEPATKDQDGNRPVKVYRVPVEKAKTLLTSPFDVVALEQAAKSE